MAYLVKSHYGIVNEYGGNEIIMKALLVEPNFSTEHGKKGWMHGVRK